MSASFPDYSSFIFHDFWVIVHFRKIPSCFHLASQSTIAGCPKFSALYVPLCPDISAIHISSFPLHFRTIPSSYFRKFRPSYFIISASFPDYSVVLFPEISVIHISSFPFHFRIIPSFIFHHFRFISGLFRRPPVLAVRVIFDLGLFSLETETQQYVLLGTCGIKTASAMRACSCRLSTASVWACVSLALGEKLVLKLFHCVKLSASGLPLWNSHAVMTLQTLSAMAAAARSKLKPCEKQLRRASTVQQGPGTEIHFFVSSCELRVTSPAHARAFVPARGSQVSRRPAPMQPRLACPSCESVNDATSFPYVVSFSGDDGASNSTLHIAHRRSNNMEAQQIDREQQTCESLSRAVYSTAYSVRATRSLSLSLSLSLSRFVSICILRAPTHTPTMVY